MTYSWGLDEHTDLYLISEESYLDRHRFGVHEEKYDDTPQTTSIVLPKDDEAHKYNERFRIEEAWLTDCAWK